MPQIQSGKWIIIIKLFVGVGVWVGRVGWALYSEHKIVAIIDTEQTADMGAKKMNC